MKSKINYKKPDSNSYDGAKADKYIADEFSFVSQHSTNTPVSGRPDEEKLRHAFPSLSALINLDLSEPKQIILAIRGMEYANTDNYFIEPKTNVEVARNEIFFIKAASYWKRKMLPIDAVKQIIAIQKHEHLEVTMIKSRLLPFERW